MRIAAAAALGVAIVAGGMAVAQEAVEPAPQEGATVSDAGWWNRVRPTVPGGGLPTGPTPAPPAPGVPAGSLVVGATAGEPDAVTAVAIDPELAPGATVEQFELVLRERSDPGANLNTSSAAIVACPIDGFWVGGENGEWETQPSADCDLASAPGTRADDGTWTFDLRPIGELWASGTLLADGVLLMEDVEAPASFRAVFEGLGDLGVGVRFAASGGEVGEDPFAGGGGFDDGTGGSFDGGGGGGAPTGSFTPPAVPGPASSPPPPDAVAVPVPTTDTGDDVALPAVPVAGSVSPLGSLPWWTWVLVIVVGAFALSAMVALGPAGEPALGAGRGRGVTRAIEARMSPEEP